MPIRKFFPKRLWLQIFLILLLLMIFPMVILGSTLIHNSHMASDNQSWLVILFGILAAAFISFIIAKKMSHPLDEMIQATQRVAEGDLSVTLPIYGSDEINHLKQSFNQMILELKKARQMEKLSIVGKSATSIAHELKNSLALVKTFIQLIPERHQEKNFLRDATVTIIKELDSWNAMLNNLRDFTGEPKPLELSVANINEVVKEATYMTLLKKNQVVPLNVHIANEKLFALLNEDKLRHVVYNLVSNAIEATTAGNKVMVRTFSGLNTKQNSVVGFEVTNTGEGISPENLDQIFNPFFTTKPTGLGLGLVICRDIVQRHNGHLEVINQIGEKVTFRVQLPVLADNVSRQGRSYDLR
jgi:signal transduction histidine kinase